MHIYMVSSGDTMLPKEKRAGAIEPYVYGLSKELSRGNIVDVFSYGDGEEKTKSLRIRTFTYKPGAISKMGPLFLEHFTLGGMFLDACLLRDIARVYKRRPIDILHMHNTIPAPVATICRFLLNTPAVCSVHSYYRPVTLLQRFDKLLPVSEYMKRYLCREKGINPNKVDVLPIGIDPNEWVSHETSEQAKRQLGLRGHKVILFVGRKCPEKGPEVLIEALPSVIPRNPKVLAIMLGADYWHESTRTSYTRFLSAKAMNLNIEKNIILKSWVAEDVLKQYLNAADVVVVPSVWQEPFGKVVIEALAYEKPVVASAVGGIQEIVSHENNGLLVPPGDSDALAGAISLVLNDAELAKSLGMAGRETVEKRFSFEVVANRCLEIYNSLNG